jgi:hypothetical protein
MLKVSYFPGESVRGPEVIPLFGPADSAFEKVAAPTLQSEVVQYIETLRPQNNSQYVLVNAMGAGEFYGSNINGDHFPENGLIHRPDEWHGVPSLDRIKSKAWPYGFPTFYNAHPFAHHRNKDPMRAFGEVELAVWNDGMKRVELVTRCDKDKCFKFGGVGVWDKLQDGQFPDVSMGTKVPFDTCSICLDWKLYREALQTFKPGRHKHPGIAVLEFHKRLKAKNGVGIRGLSITRKDYCEHAKRVMNRILPDGRKVFVYNDFPRFFDISFVFIGADKTAKVMLKIADGSRKLWSLPSAEVAEKLGYVEESEKTASVDDELKIAFLGKSAKNKRSEITKDVVPSQFAGKAVKILTKREDDLPDKTIDSLASMPLDKILSTTSGLGMVLRPREFQRIVIIQLGKRPLADELDRKGQVFPKTDDVEEMDMSPDAFHPILARLLLPLLAGRSALGPIIERRVVATSGRPEKGMKPPSSHPSDLLRKIGAAYNGYRQGIMDQIVHAQPLLDSAVGPHEVELHKLAHAPVEEVFTPLSFTYFKEAFLDEVPLGDPAGTVVHLRNQANASV